MRNVFAKLWSDDAGIVGLEYLVLATIIGLGLIVGASTVAVAISNEYTELADGVLALSQAYSTPTFSTCSASKTGVLTTDTAADNVFSVVTPGTQNITEADICTP